MLLIVFIVIGVALIIAGGVIIAQSFSDYGSDFSIAKGVATGALMLGGLALIFIGFFSSSGGAAASLACCATCTFLLCSSADSSCLADRCAVACACAAARSSPRSG